MKPKIAAQYEVVGHRGFPQKFPENSLVGVLGALEAGARYVEIDVQMSKDSVPVVIHDADLRRVCGVDRKVADLTVEQLEKISCHEEARFGDAFAPCPLVTLETLAEAICERDVQLFVELKAESLEYVSREVFFTAVDQACKSMRANISIISFDFDLLVLAKQKYSIGWVLAEWSDEVLEKAKQLAPNILIYDVKKLSEKDIVWAGPWKWFLYDIVEPTLAQAWAERGVSYIETWDAKRLLA
ncbi:MAG: glycerophosphodiester phosphodiesterase [Agarilytica sp.]